MSEKQTIAATQAPAEYQTLYSDIRHLIRGARTRLVQQVNQTLALTYRQTHQYQGFRFRQSRLWQAGLTPTRPITQ